MKKYRLKKRYPSLNRRIEKGDIATFDGRHYRIVKEYQQYEDCGLTEGWYHFVKEEVENNPDFWELIEEENPKPLFITEDGVEVFNRKEIILAVNIEKSTYTPFYAEDILTSFSDKDIEKMFHSKYNAIEYIWKNKLVFSYEDFIRWGNAPYQRVIEQLAKERSNQ